MSKFQECMDCYDAEFKKLGIKYDVKILTAVAKGCGPTIYKADASKEKIPQIRVVQIVNLSSSETPSLVFVKNSKIK